MSNIDNAIEYFGPLVSALAEKIYLNELNKHDISKLEWETTKQIAHFSVLSALELYVTFSTHIVDAKKYAEGL